jgi:hypothetical protein
MLFWWLVVPGCAAKGDETLCPGASVSVHSLDKEDAETGCKAAADAVAFLGAFGFRTAASVEIRFLDKLPDELANPCALGCSVAAEHRVYMLAFSECRKLGLAPDLPIDRALHRSLVAHEVAHQIATANFKVQKPAVVAQEYLAYVTMFATMAPDQRDHMLARFPGDGWDTERSFNLTLYMMAPHFFGAQAYRHFMRLEDRQAFLVKVLSGSALMDEQPP